LRVASTTSTAWAHHDHNLSLQRKRVRFDSSCCMFEAIAGRMPHGNNPSTMCTTLTDCLTPVPSRVTKTHWMSTESPLRRFGGANTERSRRYPRQALTGNRAFFHAEKHKISFPRSRTHAKTASREPQVLISTVTRYM
jgi:hypothetical protein